MIEINLGNITIEITDITFEDKNLFNLLMNF